MNLTYKNREGLQVSIVIRKDLKNRSHFHGLIGGIVEIIAKTRAEAKNKCNSITKDQVRKEQDLELSWINRND